MRRLAVLLVLLVIAPLMAQEAAVPSLTEVQQLTMQRAALAAENAQLRLALMQAAATRASDDMQRLMASYAREGFALRRGDDGVWRYAPNTP